VLALLLIQRVVDSFIEPRLTGHKLGLSPLIVLLSLAFWGWLWGVVGMILAVLLTVIANPGEHPSNQAPGHADVE
jgi:predicted PurR-regulated permease PerM